MNEQDCEYRKELAAEFRQAVDALRPALELPQHVPPLVEDWLRSAWRGSSREEDRSR